MYPRVQAFIRIVLPAGLALVLMAQACQRNNRPAPQQDDPKALKKELLDMNKRMLSEDSLRIVNYIERHNYDMELQADGIWLEIYENGKGPAIETDDLVRYNYRVELLDGTLCYTSDSTGAKTIQAGRSGQEVGFEYSLLKLRQGDHARFILLPHHAHGLLGDRKRIPPYSTIVYDVTILDIKKN